MPLAIWNVFNYVSTRQLKTKKQEGWVYWKIPGASLAEKNIPTSEFITMKHIDNRVTPQYVPLGRHHINLQSLLQIFAMLDICKQTQIQH